MITTTIHAPNSTTVIGARTFATQLDADLATGVRGGNKFRLIARIWWHMSTGMASAHNEAAYLAFRTQQARRTFAQLHADFDSYLPAQWQAAR